jgi:hydrogenase maturation protease
MSRPDGPLLVLGVGNILLKDEGVGVRVAMALAAACERGEIAFGHRLDIVDGGTLGLDLLPQIEDSAALLLVDAVNLQREPGTVYLLRGDEIHATLAGHVSPHQVGISDLVAAARLLGGLPEHVSLVGIQPADISIGLDLTSVVEAVLPHALDVVVRELGSIAEALAAA